jgi:hypothetical protein
VPASQLVPAGTIAGGKAGICSLTTVPLAIRPESARTIAKSIFDLILQAKALRNQPGTPQRMDEALGLYERALALDPGSALAMAGIAYLLPEQRVARTFRMDLEVMEQAED